MTLAAFGTIWFLHLLAAISPGPAVVMSARTGVIEGMRTGAMLAVGIGLGGMIWALLALCGLAFVFQAAPALLIVLKICGGTYLLWMAWHLWRAADAPLDMGAQDAPPRSALSALRLGIVTQLANPKPAVLFSAIFLGTVPAGTGFWTYLAILMIVFANETIWNILVARIFSLERSRQGYISLKSIIDRGFGATLALLGVKIAAT
ncbi:Threonine/homoserine/homoserine lactone efflux protein [Yoonia tamlensis]|uniref:Threonine/homoserine/homoserine lactone efflux protein n=1 Tax=Yoonia tamlensis TaxID=390270 RepID=A0A1I6G680_9RHOB|nr:LysE family translocator [Yoonia tamlensis]SFR37660.1 Threonine/homoserine/homoserine lactone efflux protein [Yoonia tamlensis]